MLLEDLVNAIIDLFYRLLYRIFSGVCILIDFIKDIFYKLSGVDKVSINGEDSDLLTSLINSDSIKRVFLTILLIGVILLAVFTAVALIKTNWQERKDWKTVLSKAGQSILIVMIMPFIVLAGIMMTNVIMGSINIAMQDNNGQSSFMIGGQFLATIGCDSYIGSASQSTIESMFITGELDYTSLNVVRQYYDITSMNYIVGVVGSICMLVMFVISSLTFIQRIFDVVLLYIISPISVATIPLDDGSKFKIWKDMFVSKLLSSYGIILVMNLFFLIVPQVYKIQFFDNSFQDGIVHILFLIGGSFAVSKASRVIYSLCGGQPDNGEFMQLVTAIHTGALLTKNTGKFIGSSAMSIIAGSDYKNDRKKGKSIKTSLMTSVKGGTKSSAQSTFSKKKNMGTMPLRLASMPLGMIKDLASGGVVRLGKNFIPRCQNVVKGNSVFSQPYKYPKDKATTTQTEQVANETKDTEKPLPIINDNSERNVDINKSNTGGEKNENNTQNVESQD